VSVEGGGGSLLAGLEQSKGDCAWRNSRRGASRLLCRTEGKREGGGKRGPGMTRGQAARGGGSGLARVLERGVWQPVATRERRRQATVGRGANRGDRRGRGSRRWAAGGVAAGLA
jgi:hypothetical protein